MKKLLFPFGLAAAAAFLTYFMTSGAVKSKVEADARFDVGIRDLKIAFLMNRTILRPINDMQGRPDLQKYLTEVNVLANWFFKNPAKELWAKYPDRNDPESIIKSERLAAVEEGPRQKAAKNNLPIHEERYQIVRKIYDQLKGGTYKAVASDFQGSVRFDVVSVELKENRLIWTFMVWSINSGLVYEGWQFRNFKAPTPAELKEYQRAMADAKRHKEDPPPDPTGQHFTEAASTSSPKLPPFEGSEYIHDFPAGAFINYYVSPPCDPQAETVEMRFKVKVRGVAGEDQRMEFTFKIPVQSGWKGSWDGVKTIEAAPTY